ncbi:unnamed protein product, partial [Ectocarpus sp. 12 AP-2014]
RGGKLHVWKECRRCSTRCLLLYRELLTAEYPFVLVENEMRTEFNGLQQGNRCSVFGLAFGITCNGYLLGYRVHSFERFEANGESGKGRLECCLLWIDLRDAKSIENSVPFAPDIMGIDGVCFICS